MNSRLSFTYFVFINLLKVNKIARAVLNSAGTTSSFNVQFSLNACVVALSFDFSIKYLFNLIVQ